MITIRNSFHCTAVILKANIGDELTPSQVKRARQTLCGIHGCTCGGPAGERGPQDGFAVEQTGIYRVQLVRLYSQAARSHEF